MLHLLSKPAPDVGPAPSPVTPKRHTSTPLLISEQEVVCSTAAAAFVVPPAMTHRHWRATPLIAAIGHVHIRLPEPLPHYSRREASYFEGARMSRQMDHL
jgi:hypothetical protein